MQNPELRKRQIQIQNRRGSIHLEAGCAPRYELFRGPRIPANKQNDAREGNNMQNSAKFTKIVQKKNSPFFAYKTDYTGVCMWGSVLFLQDNSHPHPPPHGRPRGGTICWGWGGEGGQRDLFSGDAKKYPEGHSTNLFIMLRGAPLTARKGGGADAHKAGGIPGGWGQK